jgi:protoporphyrin/coproporphyrin ferrochelatase
MAAAAAADHPDQAPVQSGANYKLIWNHDKGESPLMTITKDQTAKIAEALAAVHGPEVMVDFCMRYGNPSTESKVRAMVEAGCEKILFFPLYPHYAGRHGGHRERPVLSRADEGEAAACGAHGAGIFDHPLYIDALAQSVERAYAALDHRPMCWWPAITGCRSGI